MKLNKWILIRVIATAGTTYFSKYYLDNKFDVFDVIAGLFLASLIINELNYRKKNK